MTKSLATSSPLLISRKIAVHNTYKNVSNNSARSSQMYYMPINLNHLTKLRPVEFMSSCNKRKAFVVFSAKSGETSKLPEMDGWLQKLPEPSAALYAHSLPCIEAWLGGLGFEQDSDVLENWKLKRPDWQAELAMDVTELVVKYQKSGSAAFPKSVERKFSYALSRQDLENAILAGP